MSVKIGTDMFCGFLVGFSLSLNGLCRSTLHDRRSHENVCDCSFGRCERLIRARNVLFPTI